MAFNVTHTPKAYAKTVAAGSTYGGANKITVAGIAVSMTLTNFDSQDVYVRLNADNGCIFTLPANMSMVWHSGEIHVTEVDFAHLTSGAIGVYVEVVLGIAPA